MKKDKVTAPINDPACPVGRLTCCIDLTALRKLSMKELWALRDGVRTTFDVLSGLTCQPRFNLETGGGVRTPRKAGDLLEELKDWLGGYEQAIVNVARETKPETGDDAEWRGHLLVGFLADLTDSLPEIAALATAVARDEVRARFHDIHSIAMRASA